MDYKNAITYGLMSINTIFSLANIKEIIGLILLIIQLVWAMIIIVFKIINAFKDKKITTEEVEDIKESIEDFNDTLNKLEDKEDDSNGQK